MAREEEKRKREAEAAKTRLESEQKKQGNEITQMFDRLKLENDQVSHHTGLELRISRREWRITIVAEQRPR